MVFTSTYLGHIFYHTRQIVAKSLEKSSQKCLEFSWKRCDLAITCKFMNFIYYRNACSIYHIYITWVQTHAPSSNQVTITNKSIESPTIVKAQTNSFQYIKIQSVIAQLNKILINYSIRQE